MVWDNNQMFIKPRHHSTKDNAQMHSWGFAYAIKGRVACETSSNNCVSATDLPVTTFLPSHNDEEALRERMQCIIKRSLCTYVDAFKVSIYI